VPGLKHDRQIGEALRRLGVKNPGDVNYSPEIQLVSQLEDLRHLLPPLAVPMYGCHYVSGPQVGEHSGASIQAGGGGIWILQIKAISSCKLVDIFVNNFTSLNLNQATIIDSSIFHWGSFGTPTRAFLRTGTRIAAPPLNAPFFDNTFANQMNTWPQFPVYVPPGAGIDFINTGANSSFQATVFWLEPPLGT
jgi:hypothetical protein